MTINSVRHLAAALALSLTPATTLASIPTPTADQVPFNHTIRLATHNSYWILRDPVVDPFATGTQMPLTDQLLFEGVRALEIDIHKAGPHDWSVSHTSRPKNSLCNPLGNCLEQVLSFHHAVPEHDPIIIIVELKEIFQRNFDSDHTPEDFDRILEEKLGSILFRPRELLTRCPGAASLRECVRTAGWPAISALRGKVLVTVLGNWRWCRVGHGASGWATYATAGSRISERSAFPMQSDWGDFRRERCGDEFIPPAMVDRAIADSAFLQCERYDEPEHVAGIERLVEEGVIVRGASSFTIPEQEDRLRHGFQLLQTDYPWIRTRTLSPFTPTLARESADRGAPAPVLRELGEKTLLPENGAVRFENRGETNDWQTLASTTRESPKARKFPNPQGKSAESCLVAQETVPSISPGSPGVQPPFFRICRVLDAKKLRTRIRISWSDGTGSVQEREVPADQNWIRLLTYRGAGDRPCAAAYSDPRVSKAGLDRWKLQASNCFERPLDELRIESHRGPSLFAGTRRNGILVSLSSKSTELERSR